MLIFAYICLYVYYYSSENLPVARWHFFTPYYLFSLSLSFFLCILSSSISSRAASYIFIRFLVYDSKVCKLCWNSRWRKGKWYSSQNTVSSCKVLPLPHQRSISSFCCRASGKENFDVLAYYEWSIIARITPIPLFTRLQFYSQDIIMANYSLQCLLCRYDCKSRDDKIFLIPIMQMYRAILYTIMIEYELFLINGNIM